MNGEKIGTSKLNDSTFIKSFIDAISKQLKGMDAKLTQYKNAQRELEKLSIDLEKKGDEINNVLNSINSTRAKYNALQAQINSKKNANPLDQSQVKKMIEDLKKEEKNNETKKQELMEKLNVLRIKYRPQMQKYQMLEDTLYNKETDELYKVNSINYELKLIYNFLIFANKTNEEIIKIRKSIKKIIPKDTTETIPVINAFNFIVDKFANVTFPFGEFYYQCLVVLMLICIKDPNMNTSVEVEKFKKTMADIETDKQPIKYSFKDFFFRKSTPPVTTPAPPAPVEPTTPPPNTITTQPPEEKSVRQLQDISKRAIVTGGSLMGNLYDTITHTANAIKQKANMVGRHTTKGALAVTALPIGVPVKILSLPFVLPPILHKMLVGDKIRDTLKNINTAKDFENIVLNDNTVFYNNEYKFRFYIIKRLLKHFMKKNFIMGNSRNDTYLEFIFSIIKDRYTFEDSYKSLEKDIYDFISTDIFFEDLKNEIYLVYGRNGNIYTFNTIDTEYNNIKDYLQKKYKDNWGDYTTINKPTISDLEKDLSVAQQAPVQKSGVIKGGSVIRELNKKQYYTLTPLFHAFQFQRFNTDNEFIELFKAMFYQCYKFAVDNDPSAVKRFIRGQIMQNDIKKAFSTFTGYFTSNPKLKNYKDLLKPAKPDGTAGTPISPTGMCKDIENKFLMLQNKCKPQDYTEDYNDLYFRFLDIFSEAPKPYEHKVDIKVLPSVIDANKTNFMATTTVEGDSLEQKLNVVDEALATNPFINTTIPNMQAIQENLISIITPNGEDIPESEINNIVESEDKTTTTTTTQ